MAELFVLEVHRDFNSASMQAKTLAMQFQESTSIQPCSEGWEVRISTNVFLAIQDAKLNRIEHDYLIDSEPANRDESHPEESQPHEERESLSGWGSGDGEQASGDDENWSDSLEDKDSSYWESYLGGPDD